MLNRLVVQQAPSGQTLAPAAHPVASIAEIVWPVPQIASKLLLADPGLEFTYNGRGALFTVCQEIVSKGKRNILLPAYHCPSGVTPAIRAGLTPVFYRIRRDLTVDYEDLFAKVGPDTAAVLVIHYFGLATDLEPLKVLRKRGIDLIEDWSHSFLHVSPLRLAGGDSDYRIYSFWKLVPCMVGGGLWRRDVDDQRLRKAMPAPPMRERVVRLKRMLEEALSHSDHKRSKALVARLEATRLALRRPAATAALYVGEGTRPGESHYPFDLILANSRIPGTARKILHATDFARLAQKRRDNFSLYGRLLSNTGKLQVLHSRLTAEVCPWVFPVLLQQRNEIDYLWRAQGVALHTFGIYLHSALFKSTDEATIADAKFLSDHLLCLAIHQDIGTAQIDCSAATINRFLADSGGRA
jgi:perosamine synthetase